MAVSPDQTPLFRKAIRPWYDTDAVCVLTGVLMLLVFLFAVAGISVALETPEGSRHIWVPGTLLVLSAIVILTLLVHLLRRCTKRFKKEFQ